MPWSWIFLASLSLVGVVAAAFINHRSPHPRLSPLAALERQWTRYATLSGRASRSEWWWPWLAYLLLNTALETVGLLTGHRPTLIINLIAVAAMLPGLAVTVRRLHDTDRSAWWFLLAFTGVGVLVLLWWVARPSQPHPNRYGPAPHTISAETWAASNAHASTFPHRTASSGASQTGRRPWTMSGPPRRALVWQLLTVVGLTVYGAGRIDIDEGTGLLQFVGFPVLLIGGAALAVGLIGLRGAPLFTART